MLHPSLRREVVLVTSRPEATQLDLEEQGFRVLAVEDCSSALQVIQGHPFDALLVAMDCEHQEGFLQRLQDTDAALQVVVLADPNKSEDEAADSRIDLIVRSAPLVELRKALCRAVELTRLRRDNLGLRQRLAQLTPMQAASSSGDSGLSSSATGLVIGGNADLASINRAHVMAVLAQHHGNKAQTARALGINRRSLYRLLEKYKLA